VGRVRARPQERPARTSEIPHKEGELGGAALGAPHLTHPKKLAGAAQGAPGFGKDDGRSGKSHDVAAAMAGTDITEPGASSENVGGQSGTMRVDEMAKPYWHDADVCVPALQ